MNVANAFLVPSASNCLIPKAPINFSHRLNPFLLPASHLYLNQAIITLVCLFPTTPIRPL